MRLACLLVLSLGCTEFPTEPDAAANSDLGPNADVRPVDADDGVSKDLRIEPLDANVRDAAPVVDADRSARLGADRPALPHRAGRTTRPTDRAGLRPA
jgi:hypothetical protein